MGGHVIIGPINKSAAAMRETSSGVAQFNQRLRRIESDMQDDNTPTIPLTKEIRLTRGKVAVVDAEDYERVSAFKWHVAPGRNGKWYASSKVRQRKILLHRFILGFPSDREVDHRNGNSLDCRKANLRPATRCQNNQNHPLRRTSTTGFKGVVFQPKASRINPWRARIEKERQRLSIGYYPTAEAAARAYDAKARALFGEFAWLNFPSE